MFLEMKDEGLVATGIGPPLEVFDFQADTKKKRQETHHRLLAVRGRRLILSSSLVTMVQETLSMTIENDGLPAPPLYSFFLGSTEKKKQMLTTTIMSPFVLLLLPLMFSYYFLLSRCRLRYQQFYFG